MGKKELVLIAVFLAGAKNKVLWLGKDVSRHFYWVAWPPMKWPMLRTIRKVLGFKIVKLDELRCESEKILDRAIHIAGNEGYYEIFIPESFSPKRKINIGQLAIDYLSAKGILKEKISTWGDAVGTANKAEIVARHIWVRMESDMHVTLHLPVMAYHSKRLMRNVRGLLERMRVGKDVKIIHSEIFPCKWDTRVVERMRDEMRYNLWAEKWKTRIEKIPWLARFIERMERKGRKKA